MLWLQEAEEMISYWTGAKNGLQQRKKNLKLR
jgi:hypothetical protein